MHAAHAARCTLHAARTLPYIGPRQVRLALIDYLREWGPAEQIEHLQKSVTRDLLAFEVKHAVVPVQVFACTHTRTHAHIRTHAHMHAHEGTHAHTCTFV